MGKNITKNKLNILYYAFFLVIAIASLYYCFKNIQFEDISEQLKNTNIGLVSLSLLPALAAFILRALRWQIMIEPLGYKPSFWRVFSAVMVGYLANLGIPRIGEITRCTVLSKTDKISGTALFGTVVTERVIDLLSLMIITGSMLIFKRDLFINLFASLSPAEEGRKSNFILIALIALVSICIVAFIFRRRIIKLAKSLLYGLSSIFKMKNYPAFILYTVLLWVCFWLTSYIVAEAMSSISRFITPVDGLFLLVIGSMGWIIPTPGGSAGSFHWLVATALGLYSIPFADGVIFATIAHESQVLLMIILGFIALTYVSVISKKAN